MSDLINTAANILLGSYSEPIDWAEKYKGDEQRVRHIVQDGSRQHVISWVGTEKGAVRKCSCPDCEINPPQS